MTHDDIRSVSTPETPISSPVFSVLKDGSTLNVGLSTPPFVCYLFIYLIFYIISVSSHLLSFRLFFLFLTPTLNRGCEPCQGPCLQSMCAQTFPSSSIDLRNQSSDSNCNLWNVWMTTTKGNRGVPTIVSKFFCSQDWTLFQNYIKIVEEPLLLDLFNNDSPFLQNKQKQIKTKRERKNLVVLTSHKTEKTEAP